MGDDLKNLGKRSWLENAGAKGGTGTPGRRDENVVTRYSATSDMSLDEMRALVESAPDVAVFKDALAFNLYASGNFDEAIPHFQDLIAAGHDVAKQRFYLGNAFYQKGAVREALEQWREVCVTPGVDRDLRLKATQRLQKVRKEMQGGDP